MDSYDAILEQVKRSRAHGLDAIAGRLNEVAASLAELLPDRDLDAVEEALAGLHRQAAAAGERANSAEDRVAALAARVAELESAPPAAVAAAPVATGVSLDLLRRLDQGSSQSDLLKELLPVLAEHAARVVVLVIKGAGVAAWSGIGFANAERLRSWTVADASASEALTALARDAKPVVFDPQAAPVMSSWVSQEAVPTRALLVPVVLRGKIMGGIYVDRVEGLPWNPEVAQCLVALACWMIDTLHNRTAAGTPMLAVPAMLSADEAPATPEQVFVAAAEPEYLPEPELEPEPEPEPEPEYAVEAEVEPEYVVQPEYAAEPDYAAEPALAAEPEYDPSATMRVDMDDAMFAQAAVEAARHSEVEAEPEYVPEPPRPVGPVPVSPVVPPPPRVAVPPVVPDGPQLSPEEQAKHEEARRFARLLVSEIKLYNEDEVAHGRAAGDLYHRLKEDIDRSREMFEKRISAAILAQRDYFYEELVRLLADGDPDALGM